MIDIKDIQGNILLSVPITEECERVEELMKSDYVQLSWNSDSRKELPVGSYIEYNGEKLSLLEPYKPEQKDELEFTYKPQFQSRIMAWGKVPFFFYTYNTDETILSKEPDWTLTDNPANFMSAICDAIKQETGEEWTYTVDASLDASASLSFQTTDIYSALGNIANAFETEWWADKENNILHLEKAEKGNAVTLEVGVNIKTPSVTNNKSGYYTRFYAFGSTRNISQDYTGANVNNIVNKRLTLDPAKHPNGYKDIRDDLQSGEIFTKVLIFDDIYPSSKLSISDVRARLMYRLDSDGKKVQVGTDENGEAIYDQYSIWYFQIPDYSFDKDDIIEGKTLSVNFKSGALQGREFELIYHEKAETVSSKDGATFQVQAGDYEICFVEESTYIIPAMTGIVPSDGDEVILFNIQMPDEYTQSAYEELEAALDKEMLRMQSDLNNYQFNSNPIAFNESNPDLTLGQKVKYVNGSYSYETRVIKLVTKIDYPIEQAITIGNEQIKGNTQQLKEKVASANKDINLLAVFNDMTQNIQQSYSRTQQMMLDGFARINNMWLFDPNKPDTIYSKYNVYSEKEVSAGGSGSGSSGTGGLDEELLWAILGGEGTEQISVTHLSEALSEYAKKGEVTVPTLVSAFTNDAGYVTQEAVNVVGNALTKHATNTEIHVTEEEKASWDEVASLFEKVDGKVRVKDGLDFYTDGEISAGGMGDGSGDGTSSATLGSLNNVDDEADVTPTVPKIIIKKAGATHWTVADTSEVGLNETELASYLKKHEYIDKSSLASYKYVTETALEAKQYIDKSTLTANYIDKSTLTEQGTNLHGTVTTVIKKTMLPDVSGKGIKAEDGALSLKIDKDTMGYKDDELLTVIKIDGGLIDG